MKAAGGLVAALAAIFASVAFAAAPAETQVASCEEGPVHATPGPADWPRRALLAGPLGVFRQPLSRMSETRGGQLITKMPTVVEGSEPVTLSVPARLRSRVLLSYGRRINPGRGFSEIVFEPCASKPRTGFPGSIRVKGRAPVHLAVRAEGNPEPIPLPLGKPKPLRR